jgi:hypothetical protein
VAPGRMRGVRTAHVMFKITVRFHESDFCSIVFAFSSCVCCTF